MSFSVLKNDLRQWVVLTSLWIICVITTKVITFSVDAFLFTHSPVVCRHSPRGAGRAVCGKIIPADRTNEQKIDNDQQGQSCC